MNLRRRLPDHVNVNKASVYAIVINALQIAAMLAVVLYVLLDGEKTVMNVPAEVIVLPLSFVVCVGAVMDIKEAVNTRRMTVKMNGLDETLEQMAQLNQALRSQRHDFLNHLQVVYSLMEMEEYQDACQYIEQVYGDIQSVSRTMKTACAPVNALLRAKVAECEKAGIQVKLNVTASWKELPLPAWEMCRVLSNLMDNAKDAMQKMKNGQLIVTLTEDLKQIAFSVENNGPVIPEEFQQKMFDPGVSQKGEGRGMGLHIARETMRNAGGDLRVDSDEKRTVFSGFVPRMTVSVKK